MLLSTKRKFVGCDYRRTEYYTTISSKEYDRMKTQPLKEYEFTTTDGEVRYLLAPDSEHAAWAAAELSNGTNNVLDVRLCDEW